MPSKASTVGAILPDQGRHVLEDNGERKAKGHSHQGRRDLRLALLHPPLPSGWSLFTNELSN